MRWRPLHLIVLPALAGVASLIDTAPNHTPQDSIGFSRVAFAAQSLTFPDGAATSSEVCGKCHKAIYKNYSEGFGSDLSWPSMKTAPTSASVLALPAGTSGSATAHAVAGIDPFPLDALERESGGKQCIVCHFPQPFDYPELAVRKIEKPAARNENHQAGITCASCHLTPDGRIRGPYGVNAPHATVQDSAIQTSVACAFCHAEGERVISKQTQTFFEWRDDFYLPGLGRQHCQDCHMPKTVRKLAEDFDVPERPSARHLWTGGHSLQRTRGALALNITQPDKGSDQVLFHITNIGAGHSVPTGSNRRAVYLVAQVVGNNDQILATREWMFAPWFGNRPDDRAFLEADKNGPAPIGAGQADAQGPHETIIRAGEARVISWEPKTSHRHLSDAGVADLRPQSLQ